MTGRTSIIFMTFTDITSAYFAAVGVFSRLVWGGGWWGGLFQGLEVYHVRFLVRIQEMHLSAELVPASLSLSLPPPVIWRPEAGEGAAAVGGGGSWISSSVISEGSTHRCKEGRQELCVLGELVPVQCVREGLVGGKVKVQSYSCGDVLTGGLLEKTNNNNNSNNKPLQ